MKLRHRLALYFALGSSALLVASRLVTLESFRRVQEYELDRGLRTRAEQEGNDVALVGRKALEAEYDAQEGDPDPLQQLVTYGALYHRDGTLAADTLSFSHAPSLSELGIDVARGLKAPTHCFDFRFRGSTLRGVLVDVKGALPSSERQYLLLAASRRDMDADARQLLAVGWWVLAGSIPLSLAVGWWFGRRMTRGVERLARAARQVAAGELDAPFEAGAPRDDEVIALASAIREMVARLARLLDIERRFAAHAAHELRSPLTVLRGELELALRRPRSREEYEATLRDALDDAKRLSDLAEDLLVVARDGSGAVAAVPDEELDARDLVEEAIAVSRGRVMNEIGARLQVEGDAARVRGVRADLVRLLRNLVDNALEHGKTEAVRVRITGASEGTEWVRIAVEDDGPGIAPEDREHIFEHFHRGAEAREISGAGLGLGIAREVARRCGGDLELDSPAQPTRFVVRLRAAGTPDGSGGSGGSVT